MNSIMNIDRDYFDSGIKKIITKLDSMEKLFKFQNCLVESDLYDNQDVCQLLNISKRTLQRYRTEGILPYQKKGRKVYYNKEAIALFISENHVKIDLSKR